MSTEITLDEAVTTARERLSRLAFFALCDGAVNYSEIEIQRFYTQQLAGQGVVGPTVGKVQLAKAINALVEAHPNPTPGTGIHIEGGSNITVSTNRIIGMKIGIAVHNSSDVKLMANEIFERHKDN